MIVGLVVALAIAADASPPPGPFDPPERLSPLVRGVPSDGRVGVPTNPLILVVDVSGGQTSVSVQDDGAAIAPTTASEVSGNVELSGRLLRLTLAEDLRPQTHYRLVGVEGVSVEGFSEFTTGDGPDDVVPGDVDAFVDNAGVLFVSADEDLVVLDVSVDGAPPQLLPWLEEGTQLPLLEDASVVVTAIDAAGNSADPVNVDAVVRAGCCATTTSSPWWALTALGLLHRRRAGPPAQSSSRPSRSFLA